MLFLISSAPDTKEFSSAMNIAKEINADICLLQNAVYAAGSHGDLNLHVLSDDIKLRGVTIDNSKVNLIDYEQLVDLMEKSDKVVGIF